jgi:hypothetical protein
MDIATGIALVFAPSSCCLPPACQCRRLRASVYVSPTPSLMSATGRVPAKGKTPSNAVAKPPGAKPKRGKKTATADTQEPGVERSQVQWDDLCTD